MLARHGCRLRTGKRCSAKHEASALELAFAERTIVPFICMRRTMNTTAYGMRLSDKTCTVLGAQLHACRQGGPSKSTITGPSTPSSLHNVDFVFYNHAPKMMMNGLQRLCLFFSTSFLSGNDGYDGYSPPSIKKKRERWRSEIMQHTMIRLVICARQYTACCAWKFVTEVSLDSDCIAQSE